MLENDTAYSLLHLTENDIAMHVYECALQIHKDLGPGLLEDVYIECLLYKLQRKGLSVEKYKAMPVVYENVIVNAGYCLDIHIENKLIIEVVSAESITELHTARLNTYLKLSGNKLGLLINFNTAQLKDGFRRVINGYL